MGQKTNRGYKLDQDGQKVQDLLDKIQNLNTYTKEEEDSLLAEKQQKLVSGENIKTINGESILGRGEIKVKGGADPSSDDPLMDGLASPGASNSYARGDHRHPSDTSKANVVSPSFEDSVYVGPPSSALSGSSSLLVEGRHIDGDFGTIERIALHFNYATDWSPNVSTSRGELRFNARDTDVAVIAKGGTVAMLSDISGKADSAKTLAGYGITDAYTIAETNAAIANALKGGYTVVATLPTASADTMGKIYLVPMTDTEDDNVKEEYFTYRDEDNNTYKWEKLGTTKFDNSDYEERLTAAEITTLLNL